MFFCYIAKILWIKYPHYIGNIRNKVKRIPIPITKFMKRVYLRVVIFIRIGNFKLVRFYIKGYLYVICFDTTFVIALNDCIIYSPKFRYRFVVLQLDICHLFKPF